MSFIFRIFPTFLPPETPALCAWREVHSQIVPLAVFGAAMPASAASATPPCTPTIGTATADDGQATVSFSPPSGDGGATIIAYTVLATDTSNPGNGGQTASGTGSPITITGLMNSDSYAFTVTASNSFSIGPESAASNAVIPLEMAVPVDPEEPMTPDGPIAPSEVSTGEVTPELAATGSGTTLPLGLAGLLLAAGAAVLGAARLHLAAR